MQMEGGGSRERALFTTPCENVPFYPHCTCVCQFASACLRSGGSAFTVRRHETLSHRVGADPSWKSCVISKDDDDDDGALITELP